MTIIKTVSITRTVEKKALTIMSTIGEKIDEYGFIIMPTEERRGRKKHFDKLRHSFGGPVVGNASHCKGLCEHLPLRKRGINISFKKSGQYWCKECQRAIRCPRCRCCGNLGRKEPRTRNRDLDDVKRIE